MMKPMTNIGLEEFNNTINKTNKLLKEIEGALGWEGHRNHSYGVLRAVLHVLRDRLTIEEAVQLGAQLPMLVRGFYYEGWKIAQVPKKMDREEFEQEVRRQLPFSVAEDTKNIIEIVLIALRKHVSLGEAEDIAKLTGQFTDNSKGQKSEKKRNKQKEEEPIDIEGVGF